jgi:hypothetical protein
MVKKQFAPCISLDFKIKSRDTRNQLDDPFCCEVCKEEYDDLVY